MVRAAPLRAVGAALVCALASAVALGACAPAAAPVVLLAPEHVGVSVEVPAGWVDVPEPERFTAAVADPDAAGRLVGVHRVLAAGDLRAVAARMTQDLAALGVTDVASTDGELDGLPMRTLAYEDSRDGEPVAARVHLVDPDDGSVVVMWVFDPADGDPALVDQISASLAITDLALPLVRRAPTVEADGLAGEFWADPDRAEPGPAVLMLGGSEGGIVPFAPHLARAGYPTLALGYWTGPAAGTDDRLAGLPQDLHLVPLEDVATALDWLAEQPEVDPQRIYVWGYSRGAEAALLVAATYPERVHGVVANAPADVVLGAATRPSGSAWSLGGEPVPYARDVPRVDVVDAPEAEIPVDRIDGPVLLACGERDEVWAACPMSRAVAGRLEAVGHRHPVEVVALADAGHGVTVPPLTPLDDTRRGDDAWHAALDFLAATS